jgi:glycosyltransferase involved in cell wall biosynthesis
MRISQRILDFCFSLRNKIQSTFDSKPRILVLHDIDGWALDHVFALWFGGGLPFTVVRKNWDCCATTRSFESFKIVVFGYLDIYLRFQHDPCRSIVVIHDPCEVFHQVPDWKNSEPDAKRLEILRGLRAVVVISEEMQEILLRHGVKTFRIPTMSRLPIFPGETLPTLTPRAVSIFKDYPRKNASLLRTVAKQGEDTRRWNLELYENPKFDDLEYLRMIDATPIYVCASWQEGGPLPAMDVLSRGGVVVTTPVGQIQELIQHGESGFICKNEADFSQTLALLFSDRGLLMKMRQTAFASYRKHRSKNHIQKTVADTFESILQRT